MAATQTLAQMRTRARRRADMETASASAFVSDAEFNEYLNNGCQELFDMLQAARGHDHFVKSATFSTVVAQTEYALPADHYQTRKLLASADGSTGWNPVRGWDFAELDRLKNAGSTGTPANVRGRVADTNVVLYPAPSSVFTVEHWYVYTFTRLAADPDTFDGVNGWEEYPILYAAVAALKKEESFEQAAALEGDLGKITARVERLASSRHQTEPDRVQDTRRDHVARGWFDLVNSGIRQDGLP